MLVVLYLLNVSCSSFPYRNIKRAENNTFTIETNLSNVNVKCLKPGEKYEQELGETENRSNSKNEFEYTFDRLRSKQLKLELYGDNLESQIIKIKRSPRAGAIVKDVLLSTITFGLPIIIDPFRADFYKISPKSKHITMYMKYTQQYMLDEYMKIKENSNPQVFADYLTKYSYSNCSELATNKKDSLEFIIAVRKSEERAIDDYISGHPKSKFLQMAQSIKNEMTESRVAYDQAKKTDKAIAYEAFIKKYPNSLEIKGAFTRMIDAAESECIKANKLDSSIFFLDKYLIPNEKRLNNNDYSNKALRIKNMIQKQVIAELDNAQADKYKAYKAVWDFYRNFKVKYSGFTYNYLEEIEAYSEKISALLFKKLLEANEKSTQSIFLSEAQKDFISLFENGWKKDLPISYYIVYESKSRSRNGVLKLFNQKYFENYYNNLGEAWSEVPDFYSYTYKGNKYSPLEKIDYEEIVFQKDLYSKIKLYNAGKLVVDYDNSTEKTDFHQNGQLVKTQYYKFDNVGKDLGYSYEFENGVNISLKALSKKLDEADNYLAKQDFQSAVSVYESCRNNYPTDIAENIRFRSSFEKATSLLDAHNKKQEEKRLAEERKQEQARLAEERRLEQIRLAESQKRNQQIKNNPESVGKWLCGRVFVSNENGYIFKLSFEPQDQYQYKSGIVKFEMPTGCIHVFLYDITPIGFDANFYKSTCGDISSNMSFTINMETNSISYFYKGEKFTFKANSTNSSTSAVENSNNNKLIGKYDAGSNAFVHIYSNGTGKAINTDDVLIPEGNFTWKTQTKGNKNLLVVYRGQSDPQRWCYYKEWRGMMVLYGTADEKQDPVGIIYIKK